MAAQSTSKQEIHTAASVSVVSNFVLYVLSRAVWHGSEVPPEVQAFVMLVVSYALAVGAAYIVRRHRLQAARDAELTKAAARAVKAP